MTTREEAAIILYKEWQRFLENNLDYAGISDAYIMAINILKQEPCDDCISRQAVLDCLKATKLKQSKKFDLIIEIRNEVMMLPPVVLKSKSDVLDKIIAKIEDYKSSSDNAISEDELTIEGMKEAYTKCIKIIDECKSESEE